MFDLSRYRGGASVAAGLVVVLVLLDVGLTASVGHTGRYLPDRELPTDDEVFKITGGQISGMVALPDRPGIGTRSPLGVLLGQSTLYSGVDARLVDDLDGLPIRWANLAGWGGSFNRMAEISDLLAASHLRPDVVLICTNPYMLIGKDYHIDRWSGMKGRRRQISPWLWTYDNRRLLNFFARRACHGVKLQLYRTFDFGFAGLYPPAAEPWEQRPRPERPQVPEDWLVEQMEHDRALGWFDADRYSPEGSNARSLVEVIRTWRGAGAKVCIILMPEQSRFRRAIPPRAFQCFDAINRANFPDEPVPVYNLCDRIPDHQFFDLDHANPEAMESISTLVAGCARDFLSGHPAPERLAVGGEKPTRD